MKCKKCGENSKVLCICGYCPKCNGTNEIVKEHLKELINTMSSLKERKVE